MLVEKPFVLRVCSEWDRTMFGMPLLRPSLDIRLQLYLLLP